MRKQMHLRTGIMVLTLGVVCLAGCSTGKDLGLPFGKLTDLQKSDLWNTHTKTSERDSDSDSSQIEEWTDDRDLRNSLSGLGGAVLVDFYADWCGPCRKQARELEEWSETSEAASGGRPIRVIKVNVDRNPSVAKDFQVQGLPTLVVIHDGQTVAKRVGLVKRQELDELIHPSITF